jgi:hypothetical protein
VSKHFLSTLLAAFSISVFSIAAFAQQYDPALYQDLHWRLIGPFRGGRTVAITGVPGQPNVFYMAPNNGGVWKTTDSGRTWNPIFDPQSDPQPDPQNDSQAKDAQANDDHRSGSIGALAVAPSNPNIIYVGSGEGLRRPDLSVGDGIYKSTDAGRPGGIWVNGMALCEMLSRSPQSSSIPKIRTGFSWLSKDILTALIPSVASTVRWTEAKAFKKFSTKTKTPEAWISSLLLATRK